MKIKIKDPIIKRVVKKFVGRSKTGYKKYGTTLMADDTNMDGWLNHLQEELMDAVNYIERAREEIDRQKKDGEEAMEFLKDAVLLKDLPVYPATDTNFKNDCFFSACNCATHCTRCVK